MELTERIQRMLTNGALTVALVGGTVALSGCAETVGTGQREYREPTFYEVDHAYRLQKQIEARTSWSKPRNW